MTSAISLFNFGIYKNTLHRFKWGSFLYFIILFFSVPFLLLVKINNIEMMGVYKTSAILRSGAMLIPTLLGICVPTVVSTLIFNNVHSAKQSVFVHSLPVTRAENYISSVLAAFTLMAVPVLLNGLILVLMSVTSYGKIMSTGSVIYWIFLNLTLLFIMFSVAAFTAFLTGNTATHIVLNCFIHFIPVLVALIIMLISEAFLFGFIESDSFFATELAKNTPIVWLFSNIMEYAGRGVNLFKQWKMWGYLGGAVVVYILGYVLYKNRKVETSGDIAAFKAFRPIFKYSITTATAAGICGVLYLSSVKPAVIFITAAFITAIVYFVCEMLINKSFKVFNKYKGYVGFVGFCTLFIVFFAYTSVFGYETRIPKTDEIKSATIYTGYATESPFSTDAQLISDVRSYHQDVIKDIPVGKKFSDDEDIRLIVIEYELKNGQRIKRRYDVLNDTLDGILSKMYQSFEYKLKVTGIDNINIENLIKLDLTFKTNNLATTVAVNDAAPAVMAAVKQDLKELSYKEIMDNRCLDIIIDFGCTVNENKDKKIFKNLKGDSYDGERYLSFSIDINPAYKHTYALLKELGLYDSGMSEMSREIWFCKLPVSRMGDIYTYKKDVGKMGEFLVSFSDCVKLESNEAVEILKILENTEICDSELDDGEHYVVFAGNRGEIDKVDLQAYCTSFTKENLPEVLVKYVGK